MAKLIYQHCCLHHLGRSTDITGRVVDLVDRISFVDQTQTTSSLGRRVERQLQQRHEGASAMVTPLAVQRHAILLAGAPEASDLDWDGTALLASFNTPVKRFLGHQTAPSHLTQHEASTQPHRSAKWRAASMSNPAHDAAVPEPEDLPQTQSLSLDISDDAAEDQERLRFLEHSLALLSNLDSSQIAAPEDTTAFASTFSFATATTGTSFSTTYGSFSPSATSPAKPGNTAPPAPLNLRGDITDLKRLPPADHVTRIQPQTMTVNLLAAIISISPPRTVSLRKRTGEMEILEILLGDETRAGFGVTFWLTPGESQKEAKQHHQHHQRDDIRSSLQQLRAGDVLVAQNVALSAFNGCVYGQSLSRKFARNSTTITVLTGEVVVAVQGPMGMKGKFERVQKWADDFVGRTRRPGVAVRGVGTGRGGVEELPPDTQSCSKDG
ncbi:hypothetical protein B0A55_12121 [Friedmanniomyces simplex]|uniref:Uncharacterized protein n=1 Tax=Friedmanniomyces simplex TaxID=329884 RepID=A0A4U0WW75_9PEZI|nr:hypothetical protein B0A55_12121 [Friedmanniomyces simplex]